MPQFFIQTVNSTLVSRDDGSDYARPEDALIVGVRSALAVEVCIEQEDGTLVLRSVVALSVTSLLTGPHTTEQLLV